MNVLLLPCGLFETNSKSEITKAITNEEVRGVSEKYVVAVSLLGLPKKKGVNDCNDIDCDAIGANLLFHSGLLHVRDGVISLAVGDLNFEFRLKSWFIVTGESVSSI